MRLHFLEKIHFRNKDTNKYGWQPQHPDIRDLKYSIAKPSSEIAPKLPVKVDLRSKLPACWDQGRIGSCTAHGIAAALVFDEQFQNESFIMPSRLFIYYNERKVEGTISVDNGAQIRDGIKVVASQGFADEKIWPYVESKYRMKPPSAAYASGLEHKALQYMALDNTRLDELKSCLAAGFPFVFGFTVYPSFESAQVAKTGIMPMPSPKEAPVGGHCVIAVGYDDDVRRVIVRNSWSAQWGDKGHFWMPYDYITNRNLASDFWTIRKIM